MSTLYKKNCYTGSVRDTGATAEDTLEGCCPCNLALRIRVTSSQTASNEGVVGPFHILNAGTGYHSSAIAPLVSEHPWTNEEALKEVKRYAPTAKFVFSKDHLRIVEP